MKTNKIIPFLILAFVLWGCDEPETVVTNYVHPDGSVTRRVEMRSSSEVIEPESYRVPVDSTWNTVRTMEISDNGDTTWIMVAEKTFPCADSINASYSSGKDNNFLAKRTAIFNKSFRWFSTVYTFTEKVDRLIPYGYPINDYLVAEGREFFMLPKSVASELIKGQDSTRYLAASDSAGHQIDRWLQASLFSGWFSEAAILLDEAGADSVKIAAFRSKEQEVLKSANDFSSLDSMLSLTLGKDFTSEYSTVLDSAENKIEKDLEVFISFAGYTMQTVMPGKLLDGNGYLSDSGKVAWPVEAELFLCEDYLMQAESRVVNIPLCLISGLFVLLVLAGYIYRRLHRHG